MMLFRAENETIDIPVPMNMVELATSSWVHVCRTAFMSLGMIVFICRKSPPPVKEPERYI